MEAVAGVGTPGAQQVQPCSSSSSTSFLLLRLTLSLCWQFCSSQRSEVPERLRAGGDAEENLPAALLPAPLALLRQILAVGVPGPGRPAALSRAPLSRVCFTCRGKILFLLRLLADHIPGIGLVAREFCPHPSV